MRRIFAISSHIVSSLGLTVTEHWRAAMQGVTGIKEHIDATYYKDAFWASTLTPAQWQYLNAATRAKTVLSPFEAMAIFSAREALRECATSINLEETVLILSTTKGNIEWLGSVPDQRVQLHTSVEIIKKELGVKNTPVVISHACTSGVIGLLHGARLLQAGKYRNAIVVGCDRFSSFVLSGFQSFQAVSNAPCKPFDAERNGINLGEAAATIILSATEENEPLAVLSGGSTSNDANHISGPSRTGIELALAINRAVKEAGITHRDIDIISAHGTATLYNDEMEAKAFALAGLSGTPLHSFKGYIGHTLGAAGVAESAMLLEAIRYQTIIPSAGFSQLAAGQTLNVSALPESASINHTLKTASGFGGCNAAMVWTKP